MLKDSLNYEKYRTFYKLPTDVLESHANSNALLEKIQCHFCSEEWYVKADKIDKIKVCPFCALPINNKNQTIEKDKKLYVHRHKPEIKIGNTIEFGYGLSWKILDESEDGILLICEEYETLKPYHIGSTYASWRDCFLRKWLNNEFLKTNFRMHERKYILDTPVSAKTDLQQAKNKWETTMDKVFIFDKKEKTKYSILLKEDNWDCLLREPSSKNGHRFVCTFKNRWSTDDWGVRIDYPSHIKPVIRLSWDYFMDARDFK